MKHETNFDAIIVGAGPAGSTAAFLLAKEGLRVLILDKVDFPREKLCGGLLAWKTVNLLERLFHTNIDYLKSIGIVSHSSAKYKVVSSSGRFFSNCMDYPFHFTQRKTYDAYWLKMACKAGAEFRGGQKAVSLNCLQRGGMIATDSGRKYFGRFVLGADGVLSKVRGLLASKNFIKGKNKSNLATALEVLIPNGYTSKLPDYPHLFFGHIPWGYGWCFPAKNGRVIGICGLNAKAGKFLRNGLEALLVSIHAAKDSIPAYSSHALPYGNYLTTPGYANILLLGDACGLADPLLGEGIYYAHKSAQIAAAAVIRSFDEPFFALRRYALLLNRVIIPDLKYAYIGRQIIYTLPGDWPYRVLTALLKLMPKKCEETIQGQRSFRWFRRVARNPAT
jgi:geranylgeranyl reductase family protein